MQGPQEGGSHLGLVPPAPRGRQRTQERGCPGRLAPMRLWAPTLWPVLSRPGTAEDQEAQGLGGWGRGLETCPAAQRSQRPGQSTGSADVTRGHLDPPARPAQEESQAALHGGALGTLGWALPSPRRVLKALRAPKYHRQNPGKGLHSGAPSAAGQLAGPGLLQGPRPRGPQPHAPAPPTPLPGTRLQVPHGGRAGSLGAPVGGPGARPCCSSKAAAPTGLATLDGSGAQMGQGPLAPVGNLTGVQPPTWQVRDPLKRTDRHRRLLLPWRLHSKLQLVLGPHLTVLPQLAPTLLFWEAGVGASPLTAPPYIARHHCQPQYPSARSGAFHKGLGTGPRASRRRAQAPAGLPPPAQPLRLGLRPGAREGRPRPGHRAVPGV